MAHEHGEISYPPEGWWSPKRSAAYLDVSLSTIERLIREGRVVSVKVGRARRILASSVIALAGKKTQG